MAERQFIRFDDRRAFELAAGVSGRPLLGVGAMLHQIEFEPGTVVTLHVFCPVREDYRDHWAVEA